MSGSTSRTAAPRAAIGLFTGPGGGQQRPGRVPDADRRAAGQGGAGTAGAEPGRLRRRPAGAGRARLDRSTARYMYPVYRRPLAAQAYYLLGDYQTTLRMLQDFEPAALQTGGFDSRLGHAGPGAAAPRRRLRAAGPPSRGAAGVPRGAGQWKAADPALQPFVAAGPAGTGPAGACGVSGGGRESVPELSAYRADVAPVSRFPLPTSALYSPTGRARWSRAPQGVSRKVRAPPGRLPGNAWAPQGDGQGHRKQTARSGNRSGKGETVG